MAQLTADLGTLAGYLYGEAHDINDAGQIAGHCAVDLALGPLRAVLWENGGPVSLGTLGGTSSMAFGLNERGDIVGHSNTAGDAAVHAFLRDNDSLTDIGAACSTVNRAFDLNASSQVVGFTVTVAGFAHACLWDGGILVDLGTLGGDASFAWGLNDAGQVVGWSEYPGGGAGVHHALLYSNGETIDLNDCLPSGSGRELSQAVGINSRGQIVGRGQIDGQTRAFLMSPDDDGVPNPDDNCPATANADQADINGDGVGDACQPCCGAAGPITPLALAIAMLLLNGRTRSRRRG